MKTPYRYRTNRSTQHNLAVLDTVLPKLGKIISITGKRWQYKTQPYHEAVFVRGENGTARFGGFLWGYGGEGPRGAVTLLKKIGLPQHVCDLIFTFNRLEHNSFGNDWKIEIDGDDIRGKSEGQSFFVHLRQERE